MTGRFVGWSCYQRRRFFNTVGLVQVEIETEQLIVVYTFHLMCLFVFALKMGACCLLVFVLIESAKQKREQGGFKCLADGAE